MFSINLFKAGKWVGYILEETLKSSIFAADSFFSTGEYCKVNVESKEGKVVYVRK